MQKKVYGLDSGNILIKDDNLIALTELLKTHKNKIKCVYLDPPYNTGKKFEQYEDCLKSQDWLSMIRSRLELIYELLSENGSLWISIDDTEAHYLKVMCDTIFARKNFIASLAWQRKTSPANDATHFSKNHDHILVYAKDKRKCRINKLARTEKINAAYKNPDNHQKGNWRATSLHAKSGSEKSKQIDFTFNNGKKLRIPEGRYPRFSQETLRKLDDNNEIYFSKNGTGQASRKTFFSELKSSGIPPSSLWLASEAGSNTQAKAETKLFNDKNVFSTPKPEKLIYRILALATNENDIVLDPFLGSGTTAAVAHKMNRKYVGIEMGEHIITHCIPRLERVIEGEQGGVSKELNWTGGGGFCFVQK